MRWLTWIVDSFTERVVYRTSSSFNPTLEVVRSGNHLVLDSKSVNYSYGGLHRAFRQLFRKIGINKLNIQDVLVLGFGVGSIASILQYEYKIDCKIIGVEIDKAIIGIGKKYFNLDTFRNLKVIEQDAFQFMESNTKTFDLLIVDLYIDKDVPTQAETIEFIGIIKKALINGGHLIFNKWVYNDTSQDSADRLEYLLKETFSNLTIYKTGHDQMNRMMVCRRND
jgi:spermidine synthase